jgi:hypothetical protein
MTPEERLKSVVISINRPLFVLRYVWRREIGILTILSLFIVLLAYTLCVYQAPEYEAENLFVRIGIVLTLVVFICLLLDTALFKEVRLYRDKIVKVW